MVVSLNSRLESNKEEEEKTSDALLLVALMGVPGRRGGACRVK